MENNFFGQLFGEFSEITWQTWMGVGVLVALGIILLCTIKSKKQWTSKMIAYAALAIALSFVLSCIRLYRMPQGGSVTLGSMLPLMLFSASYGVVPGVAAGLVYGGLQLLQGSYFLNIWQFLLDYLIAFSVLGFAGIAKHLPKAWGLYAGIIVAVLCRAISAISAGIFWLLDSYHAEVAEAVELSATAPDAPSVVALITGSAIYNGTYLIPEAIVCLILAFLVGKQIMKLMQTTK